MRSLANILKRIQNLEILELLFFVYSCPLSITFLLFLVYDNTLDYTLNNTNAGFDRSTLDTR